MGDPSRSRSQNKYKSQMPDVLQGRFKISLDQELGEGSFSKVYRGLDTQMCTNVAVKVYKDHTEASMAAFQKCVAVSRTLGSLRSTVGRSVSAGLEESEDDEAMAYRNSWNPTALMKDVSSLGIGDRRARSLLGNIDVRCCFVSLLEFSKCNGTPGVDTDSEQLFLVFEEGGESLGDKLKRYSQEGEVLSTTELRNLQWALVTIVYGLHSKGLVHLDIKPANIVRFKGENGKDQWKLIDLDGCMLTGTQAPLDDIACSMVYASPELASARLRLSHGGGDQSLELSRLMDVWSIGMTAMEAIFFTPILGPWYSEWLSETGSEYKFLKWLADTSTEAVISGDMCDALAAIDPDMCDLLRRMLEKDSSKRASITECLAHDWFKPIRKEILEIDEEPPDIPFGGDVEDESAGLEYLHLPKTRPMPPPSDEAPTPPPPEAQKCSPEKKLGHSKSYEQAEHLRRNISSKACVVM
ncbi:unnamed protein product [Polarella glacialis]|uniref:Protein kinase domain-containing protein n=1 Tax=Polarella glacialis TaxID=89957 RepID=A0A813JVS9_POLGL|nr:unnamed protein product [Polarella glacialis]